MGLYVDRGYVEQGYIVGDESIIGDIESGDYRLKFFMSRNSDLSAMYDAIRERVKDNELAIAISEGSKTMVIATKTGFLPVTAGVDDVRKTVDNFKSSAELAFKFYNASITEVNRNIRGVEDSIKSIRNAGYIKLSDLNNMLSGDDFKRAVVSTMSSDVWNGVFFGNTTVIQRIKDAAGQTDINEIVSSDEFKNAVKSITPNMDEVFESDEFKNAVMTVADIQNIIDTIGASDEFSSLVSTKIEELDVDKVTEATKKVLDEYYVDTIEISDGGRVLKTIDISGQYNNGRSFRIPIPEELVGSEYMLIFKRTKA